MSAPFPFLTSPLTPPSKLPLISPLPANAAHPNFTTRDFLFLFPPHACTIVRSHRRCFSSHQRDFHTQRLMESIVSFSALSPSCLLPSSLPLLVLPPPASFSPALCPTNICLRLNDLCDSLIATFPLPPSSELILTVLFVPLPPPTFPAHDVPVPWCLMAQPRVTSPFPPHLPLIAVLLHPYSRLLPTRKHSQWIRDRQPLEQQKLLDEVGEMIMYDRQDGEGEGGEVLEGLITNISRVEEDGGVRVCRQGVRLRGYMEALVLEAVRQDEPAVVQEGKEGEGLVVEVGGKGARREGLSVAAMKSTVHGGFFITGSAVCIAGIQRVKWKHPTAEGGEVTADVEMTDEGLQRVDRLRVKLLHLMNQHVDADLAAARAKLQAAA